MSARFYYRDAAGDVIELTAYIDRTRWKLQERAEEGQPGSTTITIVDTSMALDIDGHRNAWVLEDESEATDDELWGGVLHGQEIGRAFDDEMQPVGRVWSIEFYDKNAVWNRRVMTGADCKRPDETDVERMQWLLSTGEAGLFDDVTTYVSTANPVNMDDDDYRRRYRDQVVDDCAQDSGKNWWCKEHETGSGREIFVWYGRDGVEEYDSPLWLSNDPADWADGALAAGTSLVWPIADADTKLKRDPSRQYSGVLLEWRKGWVYRKNPAMTFRRDFVHSARNIKRKTRAIARAERLLAKLDTQDRVVVTVVELPKGKATMLRAGMRVPFKATHMPALSSQFYWLRVLSCMIEPAANGERYRLSLELGPTGDAAGSGPPEQYSGVGGVVWQPGDQPGSNEVDWNGTGDAPPTGYAFRALDSTNFAYLAGVADASNYGGFTVLATGPIVIDLHARWSCAWVGDIAPTATARILKNGVEVASQSRTRPTTGLGYWSPSFEFGATAVSVSAGDELTTSLTLSDGTHPAIPAGGGNILDGFQIVDAS